MVEAPAEAPAQFCDSTFIDVAPRLTLPPSLPPLTDPRSGTSQITLPKDKRVWINVWATWCEPCLRELPLLLKWQGELSRDGVEVETILLSLDEDSKKLDKFLDEHHEIPATRVARIASQQHYQQWVKGYLNDSSPPIPIHLLGSADGSLRCIHSGLLPEDAYPAIKAALQ
jgi:thiol-disulfide isomerase/thioredoxin